MSKRVSPFWPTEIFSSLEEATKYLIKRYGKRAEEVKNDSDCFVEYAGKYQLDRPCADQYYMSPEEYKKQGYYEIGECASDSAIQHKYEIWTTINP